MSKKVIINYITEADYCHCPSYIHGVCGSFEGTGELIMNFFTERNATLQSEENLLDDNGTVIEYKTTGGDSLTIHRHIKAGVAMNLQTAVMVRNWLTAQIEAVTAGTSEKETQADNLTAKDEF